MELNITAGGASAVHEEAAWDDYKVKITHSVLDTKISYVSHLQTEHIRERQKAGAAHLVAFPKPTCGPAEASRTTPRPHV